MFYVPILLSLRYTYINTVDLYQMISRTNKKAMHYCKQNRTTTNELKRASYPKTE